MSGGLCGLHPCARLPSCPRVISGEALALLDTTGTLTQKYQAKSLEPVTGSVLVSRQDTPPVIAKLAQRPEYNLLWNRVS
jgi:hypothetical protein